MEQWFIVDENKMSGIKWQVVDQDTLLAAVEARAVTLPEDWKAIYGTLHKHIQA